jgi:aspartate beta-hydroxylase
MNTPLGPALDSEFAAAHAALAAGRLDEALRRYAAALDVAPEAFAARLHYAYALESAGHGEAALLQYYRAITQAQARGRWRDEATTAPALRPLVLHAMRFVDAGRRRRFEDAIAPWRAALSAEADARLARCLDIYLGEIAPNYSDPRQRPKFLYYPGLPTSAYFAREHFPWYAELEAQWTTIRAELEGVLAARDGLEPFLKIESATDVPKYLGGGPQGRPAWDAFFFYRHGRRYDDNCERCPRTAAILDRLPLARIAEHAPEVCFSVLAPGTHILKHHGSTNTRLVTHLPLIVPTDCALEVGGERHVWQEGRCVSFDDTFEHEAWNRSDRTRVVLILDVWNPYLTAAERDAIAALVTAIRRFNRESGAIDDTSR